MTRANMCNLLFSIGPPPLPPLMKTVDVEEMVSAFIPVKGKSMIPEMRGNVGKEKESGGGGESGSAGPPPLYKLFLNLHSKIPLHI